MNRSCGQRRWPCRWPRSPPASVHGERLCATACAPCVRGLAACRGACTPHRLTARPDDTPRRAFFRGRSTYQPAECKGLRFHPTLPAPTTSLSSSSLVSELDSLQPSHQRSRPQAITCWTRMSRNCARSLFALSISSSSNVPGPNSRPATRPTPSAVMSAHHAGKLGAKQTRAGRQVHARPKGCRGPARRSSSAVS